MTDEREEIRRQKLKELRNRGEAGSDGADQASVSEPISVDGPSELADIVATHDVVLVDCYAD